MAHNHRHAQRSWSSPCLTAHTHGGKMCHTAMLPSLDAVTRVPCLALKGPSCSPSAWPGTAASPTAARSPAPKPPSSSAPEQLLCPPPWTPPCSPIAEHTHPPLAGAPSWAPALTAAAASPIGHGHVVLTAGRGKGANCRHVTSLEWYRSSARAGHPRAAFVEWTRTCGEGARPTTHQRRVCTGACAHVQAHPRSLDPCAQPSQLAPLLEGFGAPCQLLAPWCHIQCLSTEGRRGPSCMSAIRLDTLKWGALGFSFQMPFWGPCLAEVARWGGALAQSWQACDEPVCKCVWMLVWLPPCSLKAAEGLSDRALSQSLVNQLRPCILIHKSLDVAHGAPWNLYGGRGITSASPVHHQRITSASPVCM